MLQRFQAGDERQRSHFMGRKQGGWLMEPSATSTIPEGEWQFFFDAFSRQHKGWIATVEVLDLAIGAQVEGSALPFEGITASASRGGDETITVMLGGEPERHVTHTIVAPSRVFLDRSGIDAGRGEALEIESADGSKTLIRFHNAVLPEQLDGLP
jgi:hypothetical protein